MIDIGGAALSYIIIILNALLVVILVFIAVLFLVEIFMFEKLFQKKGFRFILNFSSLLSTSQLIKVLTLLEREDDFYHVQDRRITIYRTKWQFYFFYLIRLALARILRDRESVRKLKTVMHWENEKTILAYSIDSFNLIDIFEFNIKACNKRNKKKLKVILLHTLFHEFRHRYQYHSSISLKDDEKDANQFADDFFNKYSTEISKILNLSYNTIFEKGIPVINNTMDRATNS